MSVHRNGDDDEHPDPDQWPAQPPAYMVDDPTQINRETEMVTSMTSTDFPDGSVQIRTSNTAAIDFDIECPDGYIIAVYAVEVMFSDFNEINNDTDVDVWWFNDQPDRRPGGWVGQTTAESFITHQCFTKYGAGGGPQSERVYSLMEQYGMPLLNFDGNLEVHWEHTGAADSGEMAWTVWYEYIEIGDNVFVDELLGRR